MFMNRLQAAEVAAAQPNGVSVQLGPDDAQSRRIKSGE
jgi:hypothetical protein